MLALLPDSERLHPSNKSLLAQFPRPLATLEIMVGPRVRRLVGKRVVKYIGQPV
jgi:hypothetical protein